MIEESSANALTSLPNHLGRAKKGVAGRRSGNLSILEGAQAVSGITTIGYAGSGTKAILVSGSGSRLETTEDLLVGTGGSATLSIENGGAASANNTTINGTVTVMGAGSTLTANHLTVAVAGSNWIIINSGGNASIANQTTLGIEAGSRGIVGVTGSNSSFTTQDLLLGDAGEGWATVANPTSRTGGQNNFFLTLLCLGNPDK